MGGFFAQRFDLLGNRWRGCLTLGVRTRLMGILKLAESSRQESEDRGVWTPLGDRVALHSICARDSLPFLRTLPVPERARAALPGGLDLRIVRGGFAINDRRPARCARDRLSLAASAST